MSAVAGGAPNRRAIFLSALISVGAVTSLLVAAVSSVPVGKLVPVLAVITIAAATYRKVLSWTWLLAEMVIVILVIPIRRYSLPVNLPFELEPYRILVALVAGAWISSLLVDPRVRIRSTVFDSPLIAIAVAVLLSDAAGGGRIAELGVSTVVIKKISFLASFFLVYYLIVSLVRRQEQVDFLLEVLVGTAAVVAMFALIEARTGYNVFNHLQGKIPGLRLHEEVGFGHGVGRGGRQRVFASAQHPIALGAAFVVILPFAVYLVRRTRQRRWWLAAVLLACGALATVSRTSVVMLGIVLLVYVRHRVKELKRFWPALIPFLAVVHIAAPGALGSLKESFFPKGGIVANQTGTVGRGRIASLAPALDQWTQVPLFGQGYGTRVVDGPQQNAFILDDEWLGTTLETGLVGALTWVWLYIASCRRLGRLARGDPTPRGWLLTSITASIASFAVGMFFYDAFSFIQVTFLLFIVLALGATVVANQQREQPGAV